VGGIIVTLVMFMLGEWAGYAAGWLYWFKSMMTITLEAILPGAILHDFLPWLPSWGGAPFMLMTLIASNVLSHSCLTLADASYCRGGLAA